MKRFLSFFLISLMMNLSAQQGAEDQKGSFEENVRSQVAGNNAFALELYNRLRFTSGNIACSPFALSYALALPYAGAAGPTRAQFRTVMHYLTQDDDLFTSFAWLNQHFATSWYSGPNETKVYMGNSLWIQQDIKLLPQFVTLAAKYFKQEIKQTDFMRNPESSRLNINGWVREKTQGRIEQFLRPGQVNTNTRLAVISSLFMKAVWEQAFDPSLTVQSSFFINQYNTVSVPMMTTTSNFPIYQSDLFTILEMPYRGKEGSQTQFSFLVFLPKDIYGLSAVEGMVLNLTLENILKLLRIDKVIASFPKFKILAELQLNSTLQQMGMIEAFSENADFSGIDGGRDLNLNEVVQKTYLSVDEKGTEAIAATAITIGNTAYAPHSPIVFRADHPFMFMIIDRSINAILFIGRLVSP